MHRARPEVQIAADAWRRACHALEQPGLTTVAREKLDREPGPAMSPDPKDQQLTQLTQWESGRGSSCRAFLPGWACA